MIADALGRPAMRLTDLLRLLLPDRLAARLPVRFRRRHFLARVAAGAYRRAARVLRGGDPFDRGALFQATDRLDARGRWASIPRLVPVAETRPEFEREVWSALCDDADGRGADARARLRSLGTDKRFPPFERMCARAWALYLDLPRFTPERNTTEAPPEVFQYWDTPEPPADVVAAMAVWERACAGRYRRFDDRSARAFLADIYGQDVVGTYDLCPHPAAKADYFRLGYLAARGGLWIDADAAMRPGFPRIWPSFGGRTVLWFATHFADASFLNGVLASPPSSPLMTTCFRQAGDRIRRAADRHIYTLAGPGLITDTVLWMAREGLEERVEAMPTHVVSGHVQTTFRARYKRDDRSWHRHQSRDALA